MASAGALREEVSTLPSSCVDVTVEVVRSFLLLEGEESVFAEEELMYLSITIGTCTRE